MVVVPGVPTGSPFWSNTLVVPSLNFCVTLPVVGSVVSDTNVGVDETGVAVLSAP